MITQAWAARCTTGQRVAHAMGTAMVPLIAVPLTTCAGLPVGRRRHRGRPHRPVLCALFLVVMGFAELAVACLFRLSVPDSRAIVFTGATHNSLVVLPLALPDTLTIAAVGAVTDSLIEVLGMVIYVRVVPRLLPPHHRPPTEQDVAHGQ